MKDCKLTESAYLLIGGCTFNSPADCEPVAEAGVVNSSVGDGRVQSFFDARHSGKRTSQPSASTEKKICAPSSIIGSWW